MGQFKDILFSYRWIALLFGLSIVGICGGVYYILLNPPLGEDHFKVTVTEVTVCKGWDVFGKPIRVSTIFPPNEESISVCGHLQVNDPPVGMVAIWFREENKSEAIFWELIDVTDTEYYFTSTLHPVGETFQEGNYEVELVIGKAKVWTIEFQVKQH